MQHGYQWNGTEIAVIGMAGRFPKAKTLDEFWEMQEHAVEAVSFFSDKELQESGVPHSHIANPNYVKARAILGDVDLFDAAFFGFTPRQATITDPQQRLFLECVHEVLENAGYDPDRYTEAIGVFGGSSVSSYIAYLATHRELMETVGGFQVQLGNDKDFVPMIACYKLNLRGPGVAVQTACSTSLVAVHLACQSLLAGECEMAIAGGVSVTLPEKMGYMYHEGGYHSPDGHCRVFDAASKGTLGGNGAGVVLLKRMEDAIRQGDRIRAVILGSAINNDGNEKAGLTAPGFSGQVRAIRGAYRAAGVEAETVSYVEAHGTGTALGDPIEVDALMEAFKSKAQHKNSCALGSVKANIGHLDAAAGIAGFLRAVLALERQRIPPCANFQSPNPHIAFSEGPFYVPRQALAWESNASPRRAAVSSFGIGGTNAHVVLQEAPLLPAPEPARGWQTIVFSAKSLSALETLTGSFADYLSKTEEPLADIAATLQTGRRQFLFRHALAARSAGEAAEILRNHDHRRLVSATAEEGRFVVFLFPGGGTQYPEMARGLYESEPFFRAQMDRCFDLLRPWVPDVSSRLYPQPGDKPDALRTTAVALPALFAVEYSLAMLWMHWGVKPNALLGHSLGEYVAACVSGSISLDDALALVALRGELLEQIGAYEMTSVALPECELQPRLESDLSIVAINGSSLCVVAGLAERLSAFEAELATEAIEAKRIKINAASHCDIVDPILPHFRQFSSRLARNRPTIPYLSNVSGDWIGDADLNDPDYWSRHLRQPVRFSDCLAKINHRPGLVMAEMGPGKTLCSLALIQRDAVAPTLTINSLPHALDQEPDVAQVAKMAGILWATGVGLDWAAFHEGAARRKVPLPTYPFERRKCFVEPQWNTADEPYAERDSDVDRWFYGVSWARSFVPVPQSATEATRWLVLADHCGIADLVAERLCASGASVALVYPGDRFRRNAQRSFTLDPEDPDQFALVLDMLAEEGFSPNRLAHLWAVDDEPPAERSGEILDRALSRGYYSLLYSARALARARPGASLRVFVFTSNAQEVAGGDLHYPEKAAILAPCRILSQEYPNIFSQAIDLDLARDGTDPRHFDWISAELLSKTRDRTVAYRNGYRWVETFERLPELPLPPLGFRRRGVYLITGGLGRIGLELATFLAQTVQARVVLTTRRHWPLDSAENDAQIIVQRIDEIQRAGGEVLVVRADSRQENEMQRAVELVRNAFGALNGVFHSPAVGRERPLKVIEETGPEESEWHFAAKVHGTYVLSRALEGADLDFCVLFSSLASILGGLGFSAYAAANLFQDAFAHVQRGRTRIPWTSINWEGWRFSESNATEFIGRSVGRFSITPDEGRRVFARLPELVCFPQVAVSTGNLHARVRTCMVTERPVVEVRQPSSAVRAETLSAPDTPAERLIGGIWSQHLGLSEISTDDNFFAMGGTSLLATHCMARLSEEIGFHVPLRLLFEEATLGSLAARVTALVQGKIRPDADALPQSFLDMQEGGHA